MTFAYVFEFDICKRNEARFVLARRQGREIERDGYSGRGRETCSSHHSGRRPFRLAIIVSQLNVINQLLARPRPHHPLYHIALSCQLVLCEVSSSRLGRFIHIRIYIEGSFKWQQKVMTCPQIYFNCLSVLCAATIDWPIECVVMTRGAKTEVWFVVCETILSIYKCN